jgi:hypothetical protein
MPTYRVHLAHAKNTPWPAVVKAWPAVDASSTIEGVYKLLKQKQPKAPKEICWVRVAVAVDDDGRPKSVLQMRFEADLANPLGWRETGIDE